MRKLLLSLICLLGITGLVFAGEVTLLKHNPEMKEVTVKDGDQEVTYKYNDKTKVIFIDKQDGSTKEGTIEAAAKILSYEKLQGKLKFEVVTDKDTITSIKMKLKKKN